MSFRHDEYWPLMKDDLKTLVGVPYQFGAEATTWPPTAIDCSELVEIVHARRSIPCPDGARYQWKETYIPPASRHGDMGFWARETVKGPDNPMGIHHVGMLFDDVTVIEARGCKDHPGHKPERCPYNKVIFRPREAWEKWPEFKAAGGWRRLNVLKDS